MKINGINVTGIKETVSAVKNEPADRWAVLLDMSDWSVYERSLIGQDYIVTSWPTVQIADGDACNGRGRDTITMAELKTIVAEIIERRKIANEEYNAGQRHVGYGTGGESRIEFVRNELRAAGLI